MHIWRIAGLALAAGLALFLVTLLLKLVLVAAVAFMLIRIIGWQLARRFSGNLGRGRWQPNHAIAIDNPTYRTPMSMKGYTRVVPIS
jgi:hypothetical protein